MTDAIDIPTLTAGQMADATRSGELTPTQIVEVLLERIDGHDEKTRAFSHLDREEVLAEAKLLAQEAASGKFRGPLHGVPFGVKEQFLLEGVKTLGDCADPNPPIAQDDATGITAL